MEDDELALEEDVAVDGEGQAVGALDAAEAEGGGLEVVGVGGGELDDVAGDDGAVAADAGGERGQLLVAVEDVAANAGAVLRRGHLRVVRGYDGVREQQQGGAGVGDGLVGHGHSLAVTDGEAICVERPEALGVVHGYEGDGSGELGVVNEAEVVVTGLIKVNKSSNVSYILESHLQLALD